MFVCVFQDWKGGRGWVLLHLPKGPNSEDATSIFGAFPYFAWRPMNGGLLIL